MRKGVIYKATNINTGLSYIGQSIEFDKRKKRHHYKAFQRDSNTHFHRALRKYSADSFQWDILEDDINEDTLDTREMYWIDKFDTYNNGYNMTAGGETSPIIPQIFTLYSEFKGEIKGTVRQLASAIGCSIDTVQGFFKPSHSKHKVLQGEWVRIEDKDDYSKYVTIIEVINKDGSTFKGTRKSFMKTFKIPSSRVTDIIVGRRKSVKGWRIKDDS